MDIDFFIYPSSILSSLSFLFPFFPVTVYFLFFPFLDLVSVPIFDFFSLCIYDFCFLSFTLPALFYYLFVLLRSFEAMKNIFFQKDFALRWVLRRISRRPPTVSSTYGKRSLNKNWHTNHLCPLRLKNGGRGKPKNNFLNQFLLLIKFIDNFQSFNFFLFIILVLLVQMQTRAGFLDLFENWLEDTFNGILNMIHRYKDRRAPGGLQQCCCCLPMFH